MTRLLPAEDGGLKKSEAEKTIQRWKEMLGQFASDIEVRRVSQSAKKFNKEAISVVQEIDSDMAAI